MDITTVTSSAEGLVSNTHLVSAPDGIIVIDPPMLLSDARAVRARLDQLGRPLGAFVYTHPHPDHVNGATEIRGTAEVPGYATPETDRISRMIDGPKREFWTPVFGDDYPPATTFASVLVTGETSVKIAGLSFDVHDIGPGECETASLWISGDAAFVGDLAYSNAHPWLFEARTSTWLEQLVRVRPLLQDKTLYVGHGAAGPVALLDAQADYIRAYQQAVGELAAADGTLTTAAKETLRERVTGLWPGAPLEDLTPGANRRPKSRCAPLLARWTCQPRSSTTAGNGSCWSSIDVSACSTLWVPITLSWPLTWCLLLYSGTASLASGCAVAAC